MFFPDGIFSSFLPSTVAEEMIQRNDPTTRPPNHQSSDINDWVFTSAAKWCKWLAAFCNRQFYPNLTSANDLDQWSSVFCPQNVIVVVIILIVNSIGKVEMINGIPGNQLSKTSGYVLISVSNRASILPLKNTDQYTLSVNSSSICSLCFSPPLNAFINRNGHILYIWGFVG